MFRGLYTVSTALEQSTKRLDVISNNIANVNTTGYKEDISVFQEFKSLLMYKTGGDAMNMNFNLPVNVKSEKDGDVHTLQAENGYFRIAAVNGISHNSSVRFKRDEDGYLKTFHRNVNGKIIKNEGFKVLGRNGAIKLDTDDFEIDKKGNLIVGGNVVDNLIEKPLGPVIGTMSGGSRLLRTAVDFTEGALQETNNPLDLAILGRGFFVVNTPNGVRYTRDGNFKINAEGTLLTADGYEVQGVNGKITLPKYKVGVNQYGELAVDGKVIDKLKMVNPEKIELLTKEGDNLYAYKGEEESLEEAKDVEIRQGFLEGSNVDPVKEMVKMIETNRAYESAQRVVRSYDETMGKTVNEVGRL